MRRMRVVTAVSASVSPIGDQRSSKAIAEAFDDLGRSTTLEKSQEILGAGAVLARVQQYGVLVERGIILLRHKPLRPVLAVDHLAQGNKPKLGIPGVDELV